MKVSAQGLAILCLISLLGNVLGVVGLVRFRRQIRGVYEAAQARLDEGLRRLDGLRLEVARTASSNSTLLARSPSDRSIYEQKHQILRVTGRSCVAGAWIYTLPDGRDVRAGDSVGGLLLEAPGERYCLLGRKICYVVVERTREEVKTVAPVVAAGL